VDRLIVERKLDSLRRCLARVASKTPAAVEILERDVDLQDVLTLNLSRAVQICVDLAAHMLTDLHLPPPGTMGEAFDRLAQADVIGTDLALAMKKAVGFRSVAVHAYDRINWHIVFAIARDGTRQLEQFAKVVAARNV